MKLKIDINFSGMHLLIIFIAFLCSCINNGDKSKGSVVEKYSNGNKRKVEYYDDNDSLIKEELFYKDGNLKVEKNYQYKNDTIFNETTGYYSNGNKQIYYLKKNDSAFHLIKYFRNGNKKEEDDAVADRWYFWYENGQLKVESDNENGELKEYFPSGNIKITGEIRNYSSDGTWKYLNENGTLVMLKKYDQGKLLDMTIYDREAAERLFEDEL